MYLTLCMIVSIIASTEPTKKFPLKKVKDPTEISVPWPMVHGPPALSIQ